MREERGPEKSGTPWSQHALLHSVFFLMGSDLFLLPPLLPAIAATYDTSIASTAWVVTSFGLSYAAVSPLFGALTAHRPKRQVILLGVAVMTVGVLVCAAAPSLAVLLVGRVIGGLGGALVGPAIWAYLAETSAPHERGRGIARGAAAYAGGQIAGVPLGTLLAAGTSWRWAFAVLALGLIASGSLIAVRLRPTPATARREPGLKAALRFSAGLWRQPIFRLILTANSAAQAARLGTYAYAGAIFAGQFGFGTGLLGLIGAVVGIGSFLGSLVAGPIVDWWARLRRPAPLLGIGWALLLAIGLAVATTAPVWWLCMAGFAMSAFAGAGFFSTSQVFLTTVTAERRGPAVAWNNSAMYLGTAIGTTVLGAFALDSAAFGVVSASFGLLAAAVSVWIVVRLRRRGLESA